MTSQDNFANLRIYFIVPDKYETEEECSEETWEVYNMCLQNEFQPQWIEEKQCNSLDPQKTDVFVFEEFEGAVFEKLTKSKCLIVAPRCLLSCFLSGEPIPEGNSPVFTTAMRGTIVCVSGLGPQIKKNIQKKVGYMGGIFTKQLMSSVTHLISSSVMSVKYEKAVEQGIPVFTDAWIDALWEANEKEFVKFDDPRFDKFKCPVFMNLIVTSTNLSKQQKETSKRLIDENGGTFMGALDGAKVKVVLAPPNCPFTDKLKYAKQNHIACLNVEWVSKSIKAGYALPFNDYLVLPTKGCSTPEKSLAPAFDCSTISAIGAPTCSNNVIEETMAMSINTTAMSDINSADRHSLAPYVAKLEKLDVREAKLAGPFLDGCNIYLAGFPTNHRDKINRILNAGGATRLNDMSDALTHVIVGDPGKASSELKLMQSKGLSPHILNLDWLEESLRLQRPAPEENFFHDEKRGSNIKPAEPPSPLSKKNLQMLQRPKRPPVPQFSITRASRNEEADVGEEEAILVQQYLRKSNDENNDRPAPEVSFQELLEPKNSTVKETTKNATVVNSMNYSKTRMSDATKDSVPCSQSTLIDKIFNGLTFLVSGFEEDDHVIVIQNIVALGGRIVTKTFVGIPDYGVVPLLGAVLKHTVDEIVTDLYIEDCIDQERLVELMYYHRPLSIPRDAKPLAGLVIATSTYAGSERAYLTKVVNALGATYQDTFARKTNQERNHLGSTHLLCPSPQGSKYKAAVKWKLPAVTSDWLKACVAELRCVDETSYLVGETMAPERPSGSTNTSNMGPPSTPTPRTIITPKRQLIQGQGTPGCETPLVNKKLSLLMSNTPQSPFSVTTPETPYGQVIRENPSPETRKEWLRWMNKFPDMRVEEPPLKRRAPSTPLSDLKRQFWEAAKQPLPSKNNSIHDDEVCQQNSSHSSEKNENVSTRANEKRLDNSAAEETPINRKLSFTDDSLGSKKAIDLQIEQLDQVLQATSSTAENRYSLSGNAKVYNEQPIERINKCMVKESQPDTVGWEEPAHQRQVSYIPAKVAAELAREEAAIEESPKFKFMLSGIKDRANYELVIKKLGGELSTGPEFDATATHLLCIRPSRNEKMLGSIAGGKWVLHCTYLRGCDEEGKFIDEERYEWGNPLSKNVIPEASGDTEKSIAAAAHRWRVKLQREPGGAFKEITALLLVQPEKYDQFARLIAAGGGTVVQAKAPYDSSPGGRKVSHCFIQLNKLDQPVDWAMLASKGILCFQPQYLSDYLTAETPPNPRDVVIPEFKKYLALLPKH